MAHIRWACWAGPASPGGYGIGRSTCELWDGPGGDDGDGIHAGAGHRMSVSAPGSAAAPAPSLHCDFSVWFSDEDFLISQQADSLPS